MLTGDKKITARFMRQDFFDYILTYKIVIVGNHKPHLRSVEESTRRRFHLVPFDVTIPEAERDDQLLDKLRDEWPAILAWMIEGAVMWGGEKLAPPEAVRLATDSYLRDQDLLRQFLEDCCRLDADKKLVRDGSETKGDLYAAWRSWAADAGVLITEQKPFGKERWFGRQLESKGCRRDRDSRTNMAVYHGISLTDGGRKRAGEWRSSRATQGQFNV